MMSFLQLILLITILTLLVTREPKGWFGRLRGQRQLILDSCALIDGRIVEIVASGFIADQLVIPQFILNELQLLADGSDSHKRERARFGLDIAHQLQDSSPVPVVIDASMLSEQNTTDDKLLALAKKLKARLYTTDVNLAKVAAVQGVHVLNVQELAQAMRPVSLPGETVQVHVVQKGSGREQGVGYLEDGTMIVVENGISLVGKTVPVVVTRMHQTVSGKMVFGRAKVAREETASATSPRRITTRATAAHPQAQKSSSPTAPGGLRQRLRVVR